MENYSKTVAAGLLALAAGACLGVAVSSTSLYTAPTVSRPVTVAQTTVYRSIPTSQLQASAPAAVYATSAPAQTSQDSLRWGNAAALFGGCLASLGAFFVFVTRQSSSSSEQLAMLAATGKKGAAAPAKKASRELWYPTAEAPQWLDCSLPGDRGFDPWGLARPNEYLLFDLDALDQNEEKNPAGKLVGKLLTKSDEVSTDALAPYSEVFGLARLRECELQHGRWAMLGTLGVLAGEYFTGVPWQNAGLLEANQPNYLGIDLPFSNNQVVWIEVLAMGAVEAFRNTELNPEKRCYPGGAFDPLGLTTKDEATTFRLKEAEIKHGRLAMIAFLGFAAAALRTGLGATQSFSEWAITSFS